MAELTDAHTDMTGHESMNRLEELLKNGKITKEV